MVTYISKTTQNFLLICCCGIVVESITGRLKESNFYSICDDASDGSNKEQLPFCLIYVNDEGESTKSIHCTPGLTGKNIYVTKLLKH